jgi:hypothetical protein
MMGSWGKAARAAGLIRPSTPGQFFSDESVDITYCEEDF